jgi:pimeloyl-ACP methyl ester carboxylesterase
MRPGSRGTSRILRAAVAGALAAVLALPASHSASASGPATPAKAKKAKKKHHPVHVKALARKKAPPAAPPPPLEGTSYDYDYDGRDVGHPERRWLGRAFVHKKAAALTKQALPVLVFLHGNNGEGIKYRWMGGGAEGDLRRVVSEMIEAGVVPPMIVAAPSSTDPNTMTNAGLSWPAFDLDLFLDRTADRLGAGVIIDRSRVVVAAHSGGGCNIHGGLNAALHPKVTLPLAGMSIDTCMMLDLAKELAHLPRTTHVVVSWQSISWPEREFGAFKTVFLRESKKAPADPGVLRELDFQQPTVPMPHDATVSITLRKWLPRVLAPPDLGAGAGLDGGTLVNGADGGKADGG